MKNNFWRKMQNILYTALVLVVLIFLTILYVSDNAGVENIRDRESFVTITDVVRREVIDETSPAGKVIELSFRVDNNLAHDTELIFYTSHQLVDVWVGEELVYRLMPSDELSFLKTSGSKWVRFPVYENEAGEEVRVVFTPSYANRLVGDVTFYMGSSLAVYRSQFHQTFPAILLCAVNILVGILLLIVAAYFRYTRQQSSEILSLGTLGIVMGLWQLTHNDFSPFMGEGKEIFLYYISVTMMLVCMIPLVKSAGAKVNQGRQSILRWYILGISAMALIQMILQLLGIRDLREMFPFTHGGIIVGAALLFLDAWNNRIRGRRNSESSRHAWVLAAGAMGDLILYYVRGSSSGLLLILLAVLCFMLLEGMDFLARYVEQSRLLAEKEIQLTNSRAMTMVSQIRSHFVFNLLNAISGMCKYDPDKADETIVHFARYLRNNINIMEDDSQVPFRNELRHLEDYVMLEQVRFGDKVTFITDVEEEDFLIPPLILQPLVENAIKHGITKKTMGGTIFLRTMKNDGKIIITIEDDGVGLCEDYLKKKDSVGLKNVRYRLEQLVGGTLELTNNSSGGVTATITIPERREQNAYHLRG